MEKREELYRGKAKSVYKTDDANRLILLFRNDTAAFDGKRIEQLDRKGMVNNKFNAFIMQKLEAAGIPTQFDKLLSDNECLVKKLDMIPVECAVRNYGAGRLLVDFKLEFGVFHDGSIVLGDEFSPDGCRLWDKDTKKKMDKDRFRQGLGDVIEAYEEVAKRLGVPL